MLSNHAPAFQGRALTRPEHAVPTGPGARIESCDAVGIVDGIAHVCRSHKKSIDASVDDPEGLEVNLDRFVGIEFPGLPTPILLLEVFEECRSVAGVLE